MEGVLKLMKGLSAVSMKRGIDMTTERETMKMLTKTDARTLSWERSGCMMQRYLSKAMATMEKEDMNTGVTWPALAN